MADFGRILTAMVTPMTTTGEVDYDKAAALANYLVDNGSDGLVVAGTTGESPTLTKAEKIKLFQVVKEAVGHRASVVAGTGSNNTKDSIELSQAAAQLGVDGIMVVVPYYNKPSQAGLYEHFAAIAKSVNVPVMLYNVPGRTSANLLPETVIKLSQIDNITAIKEASGSTDQATEILAKAKPGFIVYSGDDSLTLPLLAVGCHGIISVCAHVVGNQMQKMIKAFLAGQIQEAAKLHQQLLPIFKGMFITTNPVPVKACVNLLGLEAGPVRLPLVDATDSELAFLKNLLAQAKGI